MSLHACIPPSPKIGDLHNHAAEPKLEHGKYQYSYPRIQMAINPLTCTTATFVSVDNVPADITLQLRVSVDMGKSANLFMSLTSC